MREIKVSTNSDEADSYVGLEICDGPGVMRLLLTWPYERSAEVVEIPVDSIESVKEVKPRPLGVKPA